MNIGARWTGQARERHTRSRQALHQRPVTAMTPA
jgi:hypothetical protein